MGLQVRELDESAQVPARRAGITADDLVFFNEQVASFAKAGVPLNEGLAQLARDIESPRLRKWIEALLAETRAGVPLEEAFARHEGGLPVFYSQVIRAGIGNGELAATLLNLNQHLSFGASLRRMLWETLSYPIVIMIAAIAVVSFFFFNVVPQFKEIFADFDTRLPAVTLALLALANAYPTLLTALVILVTAFVGLWFALGFSRRGQAIRQHVAIRLPLIRQLYRNAIMARFFRAVAIATGNGIPLPTALRLASSATGQQPLMADAEHLAERVEHGESAYAAAQRCRLIPPLFGLCVHSAIGHDGVPSAVAKLAAAYENRVRHGQEILRTLLQPLVILGMGLVMGFMIVGLFLPLVSLVQSMSGGGGGE
jgi:type IV pilus assembly protein PilC